MSYFPFMVDVAKARGLIIGGGRVALEKAERLLAFRGNLILAGREVCGEIKSLADQMEILEIPYTDNLLHRADYVIAATDDPALNRRIYCDAKQQRLPVNVVDVPELCDFIFPSVFQKGKLVVGVSSSGACPRAAIRIRKEIEDMVPDGIEEILDRLAEERIRAKEEIPDSSERRAYLIELTERLLSGVKADEREL